MASMESLPRDIVTTTQQEEDFIAFEPGVWCEKCNKRLVELKRQTLKLILPELNNVIQYEGSLHRGSRLATRIFDQLRVPDTGLSSWKDNRCDVCSTNVTQLKNEALSMVQTLEDSRLLAAHVPRISSADLLARPQTTAVLTADNSYNHSINFPPRHGYLAYGREPAPSQQVSPSVFARAAYKLRKKQKKASTTEKQQQGAKPNDVAVVQEHNMNNPAAYTMTAPGGSGEGNTSPEPSFFPTNFFRATRRYPPPSPPGLLKGLAKRKSSGGKVKVLLRICPSFPGETSSFLKVEQRKKQVAFYDPTSVSHVSQKYKRMGVAAPKMFAFDSIFEPDTSQAEICSTALTEVLQAVVNGSDGCVFSYGHAGLGKTFTMVGRDSTVHTLGIAPCSIAWLFRLIDEKREKTGARFSIRISAVEVVGKSENLRDLLHEQSSADNEDPSQGTKPSVYLYDDPVSGPQLLNHSELRASTPEKAAFYLDAALASRTIADNDKNPEETLNSHMFFTVHVYQSRVDKVAGKMGVHGGRSRLHLIDLASCERFSATKKDTSCSSMSLNGLGNVIIALINGAKHVPHKDSTLTRLLRESLGSTTCRATMVGHISPSIPFYSESLSCVQFASKIHRLRRKKGGKGSSTSSSGGDSSCDEMRMRKPRIRTSALSRSLREGGSSGLSDCASSTGDESCDTVIYVGPDGADLSDRDLTDNEGPSHMPSMVNKRSEGIHVDEELKKKLDKMDEVSEKHRSYGNESMELEYDLSEEFKGNIEKVPDKGSVENLTLAKRKKVEAKRESCDFWEDPLCEENANGEDSEKFVAVSTIEETGEMDCAMECSETERFIPIKPTTSECDLTNGSTNGNNVDDVTRTDNNDVTCNDVVRNDHNDITRTDDLSHSPALDTPLSTFYYLVPNPSMGESAEAPRASRRLINNASSPRVIPTMTQTNKAPTRDSNAAAIPPSCPPSPTSTEVRSILENYVVDQMLIKNSKSPTTPHHPDPTNDLFVAPLLPKKPCVAGTAQISATSPKRKIPGGRSYSSSEDRQCLSDTGDNHSDTHSEDSYGSTKTDPLHYGKTPRRGVKPCPLTPTSLPREYKVIIRNKISRVRYLGCEKDENGERRDGAGKSRLFPVQLKYCGFEENEEYELDPLSGDSCVIKSPTTTPADESSKRTPLTITSRAAFAFNTVTAHKKPEIEHESIGAGEPYGPHEGLSKKESRHEDTPLASDNDSPRRTKLGVPRQRSKLRVSRRRDSGHGYSSGIASDGSLTDSPSSKSPVRLRRRLGSTKSEVSSSGYESMRDGGGTSHVSSDSASEKGVFLGNSRTLAATRHQCSSSERENDMDDLDLDRLQGIEEVRENNFGGHGGSLLDIHKWRIIKLKTKQTELKKELDRAKSRLLLEGTRWSFYLESQDEDVEFDDPSLIEVLEKENKRLERRIRVCKSRIMLVTSFDLLPGQRSKL